MENKSISKWVASKIKTTLNNNYPEDWFSLFGSLHDETFKEPEELDLIDDSEREEL